MIVRRAAAIPPLVRRVVATLAAETVPVRGARNPSSGSGSNSFGTELDQRTLDYSEALRTASLKLAGKLPTLSEIYELHDELEVDKPATYADMVDTMLADPRFARQMVRFYRQTFKISDEFNEKSVMPNRDSAPNFAARIVVEGQPWSKMVTASDNSCPAFDSATGTFSDGQCSNQQSLMDEGLAPAGVLTDPALMAVYWGNLAFRRTRTFHEVFLCRSGLAPGGAEPTGTPSTVGACGEAAPSNYTSPWPIDSIAGNCSTPESGVNFHDYNDAVVCANCHSTWNHRSPLWGQFDKNGLYVADAATSDADCDDIEGCSLGIQYAVRVPIDGEPFALLSDWLSETEVALSKPYAWRYSADDSMRAANLSELGQVMANDDEVLQCAGQTRLELGDVAGRHRRKRRHRAQRGGERPAREL